MDEYTTTAVLKANVGNYIAGFRSAAAEFDSFKAKYSEGQMGVQEASQKSSTVVSKSMKVMGVAAIAMGAAVVKTGANFQSEMSRVQAISGATKGEMKQMTNQAVDLGAKTAFSAKEAADGMENLSSAGFNAKETMAAMPGVLDLAAVSGGDVALAAENSATALRAFNLSAGQAGHVSDVFAEAAAKTNAEATDMGEAFKMVAPQAHAAGISLEETSAAIGLLSNSGIKGSQAGSNLAMAMTKLQNPSSEAAEAMDKIKFSAYDAAGKMKPLGTQVDELKSKLAGMTDEQKQYYTSQIYGVQGGRAMNVLLGAQSGELQKLTGQLKNSDGAAAKMAKTMQNNVKSSAEQLGGAFESLAITAFNAFSGTLKSGIDSTTSAVDKFTKYISDHSDDISKFAKNAKDAFSSFAKFLPSIEQVGSALKVILPSLVAIEGFKGLGLAASKSLEGFKKMRADLVVVKQGLNMTQSALSIFTGAGVKGFSLLTSSIKKSAVGTNEFLNNLSSGDISGITNKLKSMGSVFALIGQGAKSAGLSIANAFVHPKTAVEGFKKTLVSLKSGTETVSKALSGKLQKGLMGVTNSLGMSAEAAGPMVSQIATILPVALAVAAAATAIYVAWDSNFGNIRGVVESAVNGIKGIINSMTPSINAIKTSLAPIAGLVKGIFVVAGVAIISAVTAAAILLATSLRIIADVLGAISNVAQAAFYSLKGFFEKLIPGGKDGAESMKKAGKAMDNAGGNIKDMGDAFSDAWKTGSDSFSQFGKSAESSNKSADTFKVSVKSVGAAAKSMKDDVESSKVKFETLINTDGVSERTKGFLTNVEKSLENYQSISEKAAEKYSKTMTKAKKAEGDDKLKLTNEANAKLAATTISNNQSLINIHSDLDRQLKDKKFTDGTAMNADQVKLLTEQNEMVKAKLLEQNQIYTKAQLSRLQNGQKLNQQEKEALITTTLSNYELQGQQITVGEQKITQLEAKIKAAKDVTTKAQLQQELVDTKNHQTQLLTQQQNFGTQINLAIANGGQLSYTTWLTNLSKMTGVTGVQLQQMFISFVKMNGDTGQQMQAFATMLQGQGIKGVGSLVKALSDGKLTVKEATAAMKDGGEAGLKQLPISMFKKGDSGQKEFIKAMKKGDFKGAGKYLADESSKGATDQKKHEKAGESNGNSVGKGLDKSKHKVNKSAKELAKSSKTAAGEVKFNSVGTHMADGVAVGIEKNTKAATGAMRNLVEKVNEEARKTAVIRSPSHLLRDEVGKYLSLGVATGINDYAFKAVNAMGNVISSIKDIATSDSLNFQFDDPFGFSYTRPEMANSGSFGNIQPLVIEIPLNIDSTTVAKATAKPMRQALNKLDSQQNRMKGTR